MWFCKVSHCLVLKDSLAQKIFVEGRWDSGRAGEGGREGGKEGDGRHGTSEWREAE